ncbi:hypothetical protein BUALT_Bualt13G0087700 [Buddleja alternifolia]|uniref:Glycosyltransferase n=1 Tax=Buddleja alternifolia TaxID=168488 RepID=A0AAV6WMX9_9LAMI|nr:hypothetical protein BUALT_Bualt13G0087700 [Buddleja alternifolia]
MEKSGAERRRGVVLVPYPFQGHITPMLQLASILHSKGFSIFIAHTQFNSPNPSSHPDFTFLPLSDHLTAADTSFYNLLNAHSIMNKNCKAPFEKYMGEMQEHVACIIYDSIMNFVDVVANHLNIPTIVLRTNTAAYMHSHFAVFQLLEQNLIPLPESQLEEAVPKAYPLRYKDLPLSASIEIPEVVLDFIRSYMDIRSSSAVIWNTIDMVDHEPLQKLQHHWQVPFFTIGPFHKIVPPELPTSLMEEDNSCLSWLDKQAPDSVIYVSLGSLAIINEKELTEMASGLAQSKQPFLWVLRPSLLNGSKEATEYLREDFQNKTREQGLIVKWAPQKKVLAHRAVGGFLTHCGWNSTLESICEGVPLICRPCFSDQNVNARYVTYVWRVGLELENVSERSIERAINTLMVGEEGKKLRQRAIHMKKEIEHSINSGGSSYESLNCLVDFINSLSGTK